MTKKFYVKPAIGVDNMDGADLMAAVSMEISKETTGDKNITGGDSKVHTIDVWGNGSGDWSDGGAE